VRKRRRLAPFPPDDDVEALPMADRPTPADPEREAHQAELRALLESAIDELPEAYRTVFVLREVEGLSTATTADCLGVSEEVVKTRLSRARVRLRDGLYARAGAVAHETFAFAGERCDRVVAGVLQRLAGISLG
jgi:RNA polymerase sigma-70 factor, ECF subfamily